MTKPNVKSQLSVFYHMLPLVVTGCLDIHPSAELIIYTSGAVMKPQKWTYPIDASCTIRRFYNISVLLWDDINPPNLCDGCNTQSAPIDAGFLIWYIPPSPVF